MVFLHKTIRLHPAKYKGMPWYFVTICCERRSPVFADARQASRVIDQLRRQSSAHGFAIHAYCVMPDHLHALAMGLGETSDLLVLVKIFRQETSYDFQQKFKRHLWQKMFYNHILRQTDSLERVASYIWMNPVRKGLCERPQDYPPSQSNDDRDAKGAKDGRYQSNTRLLGRG